MDTIQPQQSIERTPDVQPTGSITLGEDVNLLSLKGFLPDGDNDTLTYIYKYFEQRGAMSMAEILMNIKSIENKLGVATLTGSRAQAVYQYLKINADIESLTNQKQQLERAT